MIGTFIITMNGIELYRGKNKIATLGFESISDVDFCNMLKVKYEHWTATDPSKLHGMQETKSPDL